MEASSRFHLANSDDKLTWAAKPASEEMTSNITLFKYVGADTFAQQQGRNPYDIPKQLMGSHDIYNPVKPHRIHSQRDRLLARQSSTDSGKLLSSEVEMLDLDKILLMRDLPTVDRNVRHVTANSYSRANFARLSKLQSNTYSHSLPKGFAARLLTH